MLVVLNEGMSSVKMSKSQEDYLDNLQRGVDDIYTLAEACREQGHDSRTFVEIPQAKDMASRVQQLLSFLHERDTANQIRDLNTKHDGNRELVAIDISLLVCRETVVGKFDLSFDELEKEFNRCKDEKTDIEIGLAIYHGVCAGLAVITEGILVAPLEGVVDCHILKNKDGSKCLAVNYAGPIRSAGGTGQAISVLLADYLRRDFNLSVPQMEPKEVERYIEEVMLYHNLQYKPSAQEMRSICQEVPVYITGEGVGKEVSGGRDLERVKDNNVREGMLLVMCEGMLLKAPKLKKYTDQLKLDGWSFLDHYCSNAEEEDKEVEFKPKDKYISDMVAGRPTISQPMAKGGFRLRYGRSRAAGLAATSIHPATMRATGGFIIAATQMKIERPGKATVVSPCDSIEGPYIQFKDGSARRFNEDAELEKYLEGENILFSKKVSKIWDLGEILIPFGEFKENNHHLMPSPYNEDWHKQVISDAGLPYPESFEQALKQSQQDFNIPMAPDFVAHFSDVSAEELSECWRNTDLDTRQVTEEYRELIYRLNINIDANGCLFGNKAELFLHLHLAGVKEDYNTIWDEHEWSGLDLVNWLAHHEDFEAKPRVTYRIGTRMAKPEKVSLREMKPPIHGLIPVGHDLSSRSLKDAAGQGKKSMQIGWRFCPECLNHAVNPEQIREEVDSGSGSIPKGFTTETWCSKHERETTFAFTPNYRTPKTEWPEFDFAENWSKGYSVAGYGDRNVKGVKSLTSKEKIPEHPAKAMLRHKNGISTFRDGTIRFDFVDMTLTHFTPQEIGITVEKAIELGYTHDCRGNILVTDTQVCELRSQDFVAPTLLKDDLKRTAQYMDEMLVKLYGQEAFYKLDAAEDLVGHLFATLAPHTSGAILCRMIGFSDIKGAYFHPYSIAGRRRNSDGDIDSLILLLDCVLNFSRNFLSQHRGGQMDAPLILTTQINPSEIDKEALNVDSAWHYTAHDYELTWQKISPQLLESDFIENRLGTEEQFETIGYTHDMKDIGAGVKINPYTNLANMKEKVGAQFRLGELLHGVDNVDQSSRVLDRHLLRDLRGNIRAFGQQKVRCVKCNHSYRRPPLTKKCRQVVKQQHSPFCRQCGYLNRPHPVSKVVSDTCEKCDFTLIVDVKCEGKIIQTVYSKSVMKYGELIEHLIETYGCSDYNEQKYFQFKEWTEDMFGLKRKGKQTSLSEWIN